MTETIPGPYAWPVLGNMFDVRSDEGGTKAMQNLADIYGPVFQLTLQGRKMIVVSSADILRQVTDEKQFVKVPPPSLEGGQGPAGLFAARTEDPDWGQAHRILMPAFNPLSVEEMFDEMTDIAAQMCLKWARAGEAAQVLLTDDFTRLTLDTIALCTMDFRFNSFYQDSLHPFVDAMNGTLGVAGKRASRPWIYNTLLGSQEQTKLREDASTMKRIAQEIIDVRRAHPSDRKDLLNTMLYGKDSKTGEPMRDALIGAEMITFLVAGHETTSGLLSFAFMHLLKNPKAYLKAQQEADAVLGNGSIEAKHLPRLKYINGVLRETLRLTPTVSSLNKNIHPSRKDEFVTFCDGKYHVESGTFIKVLLSKSMADPSYFGEDAAEFNPDRMVDTNPNFDHYMKAWKPFGNGSRSCIGQHFAWQEAVMVTALILQNFDMYLVDSTYQLHIKQALTPKPGDLYVKLKLRDGLSVSTLASRLHGHATNGSVVQPLRANQEDSPKVNGKTTEHKIDILYGSNGGTCRSLAQRLAASASRCGIDASVRDLDTGVDNLSQDHPTIIVTASYEGEPPDNAARFVAWLEGSASEDLKGVNYAVFGCGHRDWRESLHRIPKLVDRTLEQRGAKRIHTFGITDVSSNSVLDDFGKWQEELLAVLQKADGTASDTKHIDLATQAEIHTDKRATDLSNGLIVAKVTDVRVLTGSDQPEKRHIETELPEGSAYECGDYLAVLPVNPDDLVKRIMAHWSLPWDATIVLKSKAFPPLPTNTVLSIYDILKSYFELSQPVSKKDLEELKPHTDSMEVTAQIDAVLTDDALFESRITNQKISLFDFLLQHPEIKIPFATFLSRLLPLRTRQYSISSSPMSHPTSCTLTYGVFRSQSSGTAAPYEGVATSYLASLKVGESVQVAVKRTATANKPCPFRLPTDMSNTPIIMLAAGTGFAPFRGFIEQRAYMRQLNPDLTLAPALLFVGFRTYAQDRLYAEELDKWAEMGVVDIRYSFSQESDKSFGCKHISDRMLQDREDIVNVWKNGARVYLCGKRAMLEAVADATKQIVHSTGGDQDGRVKRLEKEISERAVSDVFD